MGRRQSVAGGRPNPVTVRLSDAELAALDAQRGSLSRSEYLRVAVLGLQKGRKS